MVSGSASGLQMRRVPSGLRGKGIVECRKYQAVKLSSMAGRGIEYNAVQLAVGA